MPKKLTHVFVKDSFEKEGYQLESIYINSYTKLKFTCPNGHKGSMTWRVWNQGRRCVLCYRDKTRLDYEFVKDSFEKEGYELVSDKYINSFAKLKFICPNGHKGSMTWATWKQGSRCALCFCEKRRLDYLFVKDSFEKEGYELVSTAYVNNRTKLKFICPKGHKGSMNFANWSLGKRCVLCYLEKIQPKYEEIKKLFEKEGFQLLSTEYVGCSTKLKYICPKGHKGSITWSSWKEGYRCKICSYINNSGPNNHNWQGGIACEPYCPAWLDKEYKESIKERDDYLCLNPYCFRNNNRLCLHHIDYNKKNCGPNNLITLCTSCNTRANTERKWHEEWYKLILNKRYGYKYV